MSRKTIITLSVIMILSAFVLLYVTPALLKITDVDYAIFQYAGQEINHGKLPYVDIYDHKPPAMFYLNALVLAIGNGSRWGIWFIEWISLTVAGVFCYFFLKKYFGALAAFLSTVAFLLNLIYFHDGGNLTEEFALPFQFGALFLLSRWSEGKRVGYSAYLIGVFVGLASSLKQPLGAIILGSGAVILVQFLSDRQTKKFISTLGLMLAGVLTVWGGWFLLFAIKGALYPFWEAAFAFNFAWSNISTAQRLLTLGDAIMKLFTKSPYYMLSLLTYLACIPVAFLSSKTFFQNSTRKWLGAIFFFVAILGLYNGLFRNGLTLYSMDQIGARQIVEIIVGVFLGITGFVWIKTGLRNKIRSVLERHFSVAYEQISLPMIVCLVDLPVQLGMISLSGNNFGHYFMSALPAFSILCAFFFWNLRIKKVNYLNYVWITIFAIPMFIPAIFTIVEKTKFSEDHTVKQISQYVTENTSSQDTIFMWGNLVPVFIESERRSPSTFFFADPLFLKGYTSQYHTTLLLNQLIQDPPALIIATPNKTRPFLYAENVADCERLLDQETLMKMAENEYDTKKVFIPDGMPEVYYWICQNYVEVQPELGPLSVESLQIYDYAPNR